MQGERMLTLLRYGAALEFGIEILVMMIHFKLCRGYDIVHIYNISKTARAFYQTSENITSLNAQTRLVQ